MEIDANPSLTVSKEVSAIQDDGDGYNGTDDVIDYTITIVNTGNVALSNVAVSYTHLTLPTILLV